MTNLTPHEYWLVEQATKELQARHAKLLAAVRVANHALSCAERKLRHLSPEYQGRSGRELFEAAEQAKAAGEGLRVALKGDGLDQR